MWTLTGCKFVEVFYGYTIDYIQTILLHISLKRYPVLNVQRPRQSLWVYLERKRWVCFSSLHAPLLQIQSPTC